MKNIFKDKKKIIIFISVAAVFAALICLIIFACMGGKTNGDETDPQSNLEPTDGVKESGESQNSSDPSENEVIGTENKPEEPSQGGDAQNPTEEENYIEYPTLDIEDNFGDEKETSGEGGHSSTENTSDPTQSTEPSASQGETEGSENNSEPVFTPPSGGSIELPRVPFGDS